MENKILLVEDDRNFGDVLKSYLEMHDFEVDHAADGEAGLATFKTGTYDLCIFDVMINPDSSSFKKPLVISLSSTSNRSVSISSLNIFPPPTKPMPLYK